MTIIITTAITPFHVAAWQPNFGQHLLPKSGFACGQKKKKKTSSEISPKFPSVIVDAPLEP